MHGNQGAPYDTSACFIVEKHTTYCLKRTLPRFKLLHQFESQSKLWQIYVDEAKPHVLNQLTLSSQLMMSFFGQIAHQDASVLMDSVTSHCFVSFDFANTFGSRVKNGSNTMVLGNGDEIPIDGHIKVHVKIHQYQSQITCLVAELSDGVNLILGNDWLVQHKAHLDFKSKCCVFYKGRCKITVHVNPVQGQSPKSP